MPNAEVLTYLAQSELYFVLEDVLGQFAAPQLEEERHVYSPLTNQSSSFQNVLTFRFKAGLLGPMASNTTGHRQIQSSLTTYL